MKDDFYIDDKAVELHNNIAIDEPAEVPIEDENEEKVE